MYPRVVPKFSEPAGTILQVNPAEEAGGAWMGVQSLPRQATATASMALAPAQPLSAAASGVLAGVMSSWRLPAEGRRRPTVWGTPEVSSGSSIVADEHTQSSSHIDRLP